MKDMIIADFLSERDANRLIEYVLLECYENRAVVIDYQKAYALCSVGFDPFYAFINVQQDYIQGLDIGVSLEAPDSLISNLEKQLEISATVKR